MMDSVNFLCADPPQRRPPTRFPPAEVRGVVVALQIVSLLALLLYVLVSGLLGAFPRCLGETPTQFWTHFHAWALEVGVLYSVLLVGCVLVLATSRTRPRLAYAVMACLFFVSLGGEALALYVPNWDPCWSATGLANTLSGWTWFLGLLVCASMIAASAWGFPLRGRAALSPT